MLEPLGVGYVVALSTGVDRYAPIQTTVHAPRFGFWYCYSSGKHRAHTAATVTRSWFRGCVYRDDGEAAPTRNSGASCTRRCGSADGRRVESMPHLGTARDPRSFVPSCCYRYRTTTIFQPAKRNAILDSDANKFLRCSGV